jgi:hypothetical protein
LSAHAESEIHDPALECPEIQIESLANKYEIETTPNGFNGQKTILRFLWDNNEIGPQIGLQAALFNRSIGDIFKYYREHFGEKTFPTKINIVQTHLATGLGALYCRSYQTDPANAVTLFLSPTSLEYPNEFTRLVAHELTHHWFFAQGKHATKWIEEGVAYLSEYLVTSRLSGAPVIQYLYHSSASLTETDLTAPMRQMGHAQLLFTYLFNNLGDEFLGHLLSSKMDDAQDVTNAIPKENPYHWHTIQEAFRDFQIAKFLNRQDYFANDDLARNQYFLFPTTIQAVAQPTPPLREWSAVEYKTLSALKAAQKPQGSQYEDISVVDNPGRPIAIEAGAANQGNGTRYFRIIYESKSPKRD